GLQIKCCKEIVVQCGLGRFANILHHIEYLSDSHILGVAPDLRHITDMVSIRPFFRNGSSFEQDVARLWYDHAEHRLNQSCLATPVGADQGDTFTAFELERDVFQDLQLAKALCNMLNLDHRSTGFISGLSSLNVSGVRLGNIRSVRSNKDTIKLRKSSIAMGCFSTIIEYK